jgi:hypothetical protein
MVLNSARLQCSHRCDPLELASTPTATAVYCNGTGRNGQRQLAAPTSPTSSPTIHHVRLGFIQCGSVTGTSGTDAVSLGWEPQWLLIRSATSAANWKLVDNMRGFPGTSTADTARLFANSTNAESSSTGEITVNPTGFQGNGNFILAKHTSTSPSVAARCGRRRWGRVCLTLNKLANRREQQLTSRLLLTGSWQSAVTYDSAGLSTFISVSEPTQLRLHLLHCREKVALTVRLLKSDYNDGFLSSLGKLSRLMLVFRRAPGFMDVVCLNQQRPPRGYQPQPWRCSQNLII